MPNPRAPRAAPGVRGCGQRSVVRDESGENNEKGDETRRCGGRYTRRRASRQPECDASPGIRNISGEMFELTILNFPPRGSIDDSGDDDGWEYALKMRTHVVETGGESTAIPRAACGIITLFLAPDIHRVHFTLPAPQQCRSGGASLWYRGNPAIDFPYTVESMEKSAHLSLRVPLRRRTRIACRQCSRSKVKCERLGDDKLSPCDRCVKRGYRCKSREKVRERGNEFNGKQPKEGAGAGSAFWNSHSKRRRSEAEAGLSVEGVGSGPSLELSLLQYVATTPPLPEPMATTSTLPRHPHLEAEPSTRALYGELTLRPDESAESEFDATIFYPKPVQGWNESFSFNAHEPSYCCESVNPQPDSSYSSFYSRSTLGGDSAEDQSLCSSEFTEAQALYYTGTPDASAIPRSLATATWLPAAASAESMDIHWMGAFEPESLASIPLFFEHPALIQGFNTFLFPQTQPPRAGAHSKCSSADPN
uniref:Zn(2)-C6 fungal-type domain-containing protein n=1 Tax=Mycena chlorophos TaxID=658473 RepID=A0ABQ0KV52_MYCCL|nr:predicted protein [Mycena chlorophos]